MEFPLLLHNEEFIIKPALLEESFLFHKHNKDSKKCVACLLYWYLLKDMSADNPIKNIIDPAERSEFATNLSGISKIFPTYKEQSEEINIYNEALEHLLNIDYELLNSYDITLMRIGEQLRKITPVINKNIKEIGTTFSSNIPIMVSILKQIPTILINKYTLQTNLGDLILTTDLRTGAKKKKKSQIVELDKEDHDEI